jgi:transcriptional regulator with XRE-family HTH domain
MTNSTQLANKLDVAIGLSIRQRRRSLGMSQTALAEGIGLTFQQVQKYERGFNRVSFSRLVDIAHTLECRVTDLIGDLDGTGAGNPTFRQATGHLRDPGAAELLAAYATISSDLRRAILKLALGIAKDQPHHDEAPRDQPLPALKRRRSGSDAVTNGSSAHLA